MSAPVWCDTCRKDTNRYGSGACRSCASRKREASKTPEQRSEATRKGNASRTPEQRSEIARKRQASMTPEQRSEATRKGNASRTPEQRSEIARKGKASMTPEQRSEVARIAGTAAWSPEHYTDTYSAMYRGKVGQAITRKRALIADLEAHLAALVGP